MSVMVHEETNIVVDLLTREALHGKMNLIYVFCVIHLLVRLLELMLKDKNIVI